MRIGSSSFISDACSAFTYDKTSLNTFIQTLLKTQNFIVNYLFSRIILYAGPNIANEINILNQSKEANIYSYLLICYYPTYLVINK